MSNLETAAGSRPAEQLASVKSPGKDPLPRLAQVAATLLVQMNRRTHFLPEAAYEDPQWLMILELFVAAECGRRLCVSDLCEASCVPATTALRHIAALEGKGVIQRSPHPTDRRVSYFRLDAAARRKVERYLLSISPAWGAGNDNAETRERRFGDGRAV